MKPTISNKVKGKDSHTKRQTNEGKLWCGVGFALHNLLLSHKNKYKKTIL